MSAPPEGMRKPLQARSQQSTDKMLDAALTILGSRGVRGLTLNNVSEMSETSIGALYHRFGDRQGLLVAAQDRFLERLESEWATRSAPIWEAGDTGTLLIRVVDAFLDVFRENRRLFQAFMITGYDDPSLRARGVATSRQFAGALSELLVQRCSCSVEKADTVYRILYSQAVLTVMFTDEEVAESHVEDAVRRGHLTKAIRAVLED